MSQKFEPEKGQEQYQGKYQEQYNKIWKKTNVRSERKVLSISITQDMFDHINLLTLEERFSSVSEFIRHAIRFYLENKIKDSAKSSVKEEKISNELHKKIAIRNGEMSFLDQDWNNLDLG